MKLLILFLILIFSSCASINSIYNTKTNTYISYNDFIEELNDTGFIIMGEFHNNKSIQKVQAKIIKDKSQKTDLSKKVHIMWEFLNHLDQSRINSEFQSLLNGSLSLREYTLRIAGKNNISYMPVLEIAKELKTPPIALNLPRKMKKKVMDNGIGAIDSMYVPKHHFVGGDQYEKRFSKAMKGHARKNEVEKYFLAQCLTDSVMSELASKNEADLNFIIAGSFHTDFYDGMTIKLKEIVSSPVTTLKMTTEKLLKAEYITGDKEYGPYADYIIITK